MTRAVDSSLLDAKVAKKSSGESALGRAIREKEAISLRMLKLNLGDVDTEGLQDALALTLGKTLIQKKATFEDLAKLMQRCEIKNTQPLLLEALKVVKRIKDKDALLAVVPAPQEALNVVAPGKEGAVLEAFLREEDLYCLFPKPDVSKDVAASLAKGDSPDKALAIITSKLKSDMSAAELVPVVAEHVMSLVFKSKKKPKLDKITPYAKLLKRCVSGEEPAMANLLFAAQGAWFDAGKDKKVIRPLFEKFHELKVVTPLGFFAWKEDRRQKPKGKPQVLIKVSRWVIEMQPKVEEESDEEESDEEEEDDFSSL